VGDTDTASGDDASEEEAVRPLAVLYEMIWSHSDFLKVLTSDTKGKRKKSNYSFLYNYYYCIIII